MSPTCAFSVHDDGSRIILRFHVKELTDDVIGAIGDELTRCIDEHPGGHVHFDMDQVEYLSSTALGKIVGLHKRLARSGGRLSLGNVNDFPYDVFYVTRLHTILDIRRKGSAKQPVSR